MAEVSDPLTIALAQVEDGPQGGRCLSGGVGDTVEEEDQPSLPVAVVTDELSSSVVLVDVTAEESGQVEQRLLQHAPFREQEGDRQASDATVAVDEGVDGLELCVEEADLDQRRQVVLDVYRFLPKGVCRTCNLVS